MTINIQFERLPFNEPVTEFLIEKMSVLGNRYLHLEKAKILFRKISSENNNKLICEIKVEANGAGLVVKGVGKNMAQATKEAVADLENLVVNSTVRSVA